MKRYIVCWDCSENTALVLVYSQIQRTRQDGVELTMRVYVEFTLHVGGRITSTVGRSVVLTGGGDGGGVGTAAGTTTGATATGGIVSEMDNNLSDFAKSAGKEF